MLTGATALLASRNAGRAECQHALALSRQLAALSRTTSATDRITAEQLATAALEVAETQEALNAAGSLLAASRSTLPGGAWIVLFSPAGKMLATSDGADATVRLWDPSTGQPIRALPTGHAGSVWDAAFSPTGEILATRGGADGTVRLWDPWTGRPAGASLTGHTGQVAVDFSPDGKLLATSDNDAVRLWNPRTGEPVGAPLTGPTNWMWNLSFSPDGRLLATIGQDGTTRLWDPRTGRQAGAPLTGPSGQVYNRVAFSPDGTVLATSGSDKSVRLWNPTTRRPVGAPLAATSGMVVRMLYSPDGRVLAIIDIGVDDDRPAVRVWDPATGLALGTTPSIVAAFSPDGTRLVAGAVDGTTRLWNTGTRRPVGDPATGTAAVFSPDGALLAIAEPDGTIRLHDPATGRPLGTPLVGHTDPVTTMALARRADNSSPAAATGRRGCGTPRCSAIRWRTCAAGPAD